ncbi:MAG: DJ-1/PfpI family protein [Bacteroidales bacterium]|nr:DJ-1/PfpI family protein [Bacteroidales bacterium]MCF8334551.1 DJ-1/PfpI family protein [Bacteroidales bacterium]
MKKVLLFLADGFEAYEAAVFTDVMGWSRAEGTEPVQLTTTGLRPELQCTWNLHVKPEMAFEKVAVDDFDALAIPGGFEEAGFYEDAFDERFLHLIREFDKQKKPIAAVCVAALPIGKAGVLAGRKATTYDLTDGLRHRQLKEFGAEVRHERIVVDQNIITSTGPATGTDVALKLLEILTGKQNAEVVKKHMRFE